jgi:hypothetical protein
MTAGLVIAAMTRARPLQCSQWSTSKAKVRFYNWAHVAMLGVGGEQAEVGDLVLTWRRDEHVSGMVHCSLCGQEVFCGGGIAHAVHNALAVLH